MTLSGGGKGGTCPSQIHYNSCNVFALPLNSKKLTSYAALQWKILKFSFAIYILKIGRKGHNENTKVFICFLTRPKWMIFTGVDGFASLWQNFYKRQWQQATLCLSMLHNKNITTLISIGRLTFMAENPDNTTRSLDEVGVAFGGFLIFAASLTAISWKLVRLIFIALTTGHVKAKHKP